MCKQPVQSKKQFRANVHGKGDKMQKFLKIFISICAVTLGVYSVVIGVRQIMGAHVNKVGGGYLEQISPIAQKTGELLNGIAPLLNDPKADPNEVLSRVIEIKRNLETLDQQALAIKPPENMVALHGQFTSAMGNYVQAFTLAETGLKNKNDQNLNEAGALLTKGAGEMQSVAEEIGKLSKR